MNDWFSISRWLGIVGKEFIQLKRDRLTFGMIVGIPIIQLVLFGFAINSDPKHLPTAVLIADRSEFSRDILAALKNTDYFAFIGEARDEADADRMLATGDASSPLFVPPGAFEVRVHARYNPEQITQYNIVPGLLGVILTMTMVMMTGLAITRERERGTMENLLATPATALEVMTGKIVPYILIGLLQVSIVLTLAQWLFGVPMLGSYSVLYLSVLLFIAANLMLGLTISSVAQNQLQAMQMTFFFFLPSILLSGFMFPFRGMPNWAQYIGQALPLTHFLRIVRGVLLKGNGWSEIVPEAWPIAAFMLVVILIGLRFFRSTLD